MEGAYAGIADQHVQTSQRSNAALHESLRRSWIRYIALDRDRPAAQRFDPEGGRTVRLPQTVGLLQARDLFWEIAQGHFDELLGLTGNYPVTRG